MVAWPRSGWLHPPSSTTTRPPTTSRPIPDWRSRWATVTVPTVVYPGDQTFPGLPEAADAVAAALPNAQRHVLPGQDHGPTPEAIVPELVRFLRSIA
jgi:pimeloyl-ACP methyl ester carboxylesterase